MRIIIFNWRDIKNPLSGGAEVLTHETAKRWVEKGHNVTLFSSLFEGGKSRETVDGVLIIRQGNPDARYLFGSVHFKAFLYYQKFGKGKVDLVIDEVHGLPFFTPIYVKEKKVALICEVADELWRKAYGPIIGFVGRIIEIIYLRILYKNVHFLAISDSTKNDLIKNGVKTENVHVIPMGIDIPKIEKKFKKENNKTLIYVGRISPAKGVEDAIEVLSRVKKTFPDTKLWIVGRGIESYTKELYKKVLRYNLQDSIVFFGYVTQKKKFELMQKAHLLLLPSVKEGFGLVIPEAGYVGTPAIAYNVEGIKDIITHGKNGILVEPSVENMSNWVIKIFEDKNLYLLIQEGSFDFAKTLDFDRTAEQTLQIIDSYE